MFVDVWGWISNYQQTALLKGDMHRLSLINFQSQAWNYFETKPEQSLQILQTARALAEQLDEPCWMVYYDCWIGECLNLYMEDFKRGLEHAMKMIVEIRKVNYQYCPMLCRGYLNLIESYIYSDPVGYADEIRELLRYCEKEIPIDYDTYCVLKTREAELEFALGNLDAAIIAAEAYLARSAEQYSTFQMAYALEQLVQYHYLQGELDRPLSMIQESEKYARQHNRRSLIAITQAWQAIIARRQTKEDEAKRFYRLARSQMSQLGMATARSYYDVLCEYHERDNEGTIALQLRDDQLQAISGRGGYYLETEMHLKKCRLLGRLGLPLAEAIQSAKTAAQNLRRPDLFLSKLTRVEQGDYQEHLK